jgi:hypothetical protein
LEFRVKVRQRQRCDTVKRGKFPKLRNLLNFSEFFVKFFPGSLTAHLPGSLTAQQPITTLGFTDRSLTVNNLLPKQA